MATRKTTTTKTTTTTTEDDAHVHDTAAAEDEHEHPHALPPNNKPLLATIMKYNNTGRRGSVSAESYQPGGGGGKENEPRQRPVVIPKSDEARMRIAAATAHNLLYRNLEGDQRKEVVSLVGVRVRVCVCVCGGGGYAKVV